MLATGRRHGFTLIELLNHPEYDALHSGGATKLSCDSHAKWGRKEALRSGEFGLLPDVPVISKDYGFIYKGAF